MEDNEGDMGGAKIEEDDDDMDLPELTQETEKKTGEDEEEKKGDETEEEDIEMRLDDISSGKLNHLEKIEKI